MTENIADTRIPLYNQTINQLNNCYSLNNIIYHFRNYQKENRIQL